MGSCAREGRVAPTSHPRARWSGRRGSNSRHSAWKADALPTELLPRDPAAGAWRGWWMGLDSNQRSVNAADLQSAPFGQLGHPSGRVGGGIWCAWRSGGGEGPGSGLAVGSGEGQRSCGAGDGTRTRNPLITNQVLYQLSYASLRGSSSWLAGFSARGDLAARAAVYISAPGPCQRPWGRPWAPGRGCCAGPAWRPGRTGAEATRACVRRPRAPEGSRGKTAGAQAGPPRRGTATRGGRGVTGGSARGRTACARPRSARPPPRHRRGPRAR